MALLRRSPALRNTAASRTILEAVRAVFLEHGVFAATLALRIGLTACGGVSALPVVGEVAVERPRPGLLNANGSVAASGALAPSQPNRYSSPGSATGTPGWSSI